MHQEKSKIEIGEVQGGRRNTRSMGAWWLLLAGYLLGLLFFQKVSGTISVTTWKTVAYIFTFLREISRKRVSCAH
jgi:hypothetical protein